MTISNKLRTATWLMSISILLLLAFQVYWLRSTWFDEFRRLKRELGITLRETVLKQQVQFLFKTRQGDITMAEPGPDVPRRIDSVIVLNRNKRPGDSAAVSQAQINIVMSSDSLQPFPRQGIFFGNERMDEVVSLRDLKVRFPVPLGIDSIANIERDYRKQLINNGIDLSFALKKIRGDTSGAGVMPRLSSRHRNRGELQLRRLAADHIEASFESPVYYLLQQMRWQILFAALMMLVTCVAFVFMYRNLRQQQQLAAIKNDFIANMTHELKTPIATVSVAIEALKNFNALHDTERTAEYLDISAAELQRLSLLVDKVMKLSMFEQDKMEMQWETLDLKMLLEEVLKSMKLQFEKYNAEVSIAFNGDYFYTRADRLHLQSVVFNLLDNALKYSPQDPRIEASLTENSGKLQLKIADNGIGIASEYRGKVFEKFFRVPHGDTHNIKGYGLGLSYVYEVIERHQGKITIETNAGGGTVFVVELNKG